MEDAKEWMKDNWPLWVVGIPALAFVVAVVGHQTGEPLVVLDFSWINNLINPYVRGAVFLLKAALVTGAVLVTGVIVYAIAIPFRDRLIAKGHAKTQSVRAPETQEPVQHRHIILNTPSAKPEVVLRLTRERDDMQRELQALRVEYALLQACQSAPEPERELSYQAVRALLLAGNVGIKEAIKVVRANNGTVGQKSYQALKDLLPLLPPCPTADGSREIVESQAMNCEPAPMNQAAEPEPESQQGRGPYRRIKDRGKAKVFIIRKATEEEEGR